MRILMMDTFRRRLGLALCAGLAGGWAARPCRTQVAFTNGIDVCSAHVDGIGLIDMSGWAMDYGDPDVRAKVVSIGQLGGLDPQTGQIIVNPTNLLGMVAAWVVTDEIQARTTNGLAFFDCSEGVSSAGSWRDRAWVRSRP